MKVYEVGTGYTSIPAQMGAATEIVVEELTKSLLKYGVPVQLFDIKDKKRKANDLPIIEVKVPSFLVNTDVALGIRHKLKRVIYSILLADKIRKKIRNEKEQVIVHFHNQYNMFFFMKLCPKKIRKRLKIAYTVHSYIWANKWNEIEDVVKKKYFQEIACVKNADYVFVLNENTKDHFIKYLGVNKKKIYFVKNGVNTEIYCPLSEIQNNELKKSIGLAGKKYIFQVGSVCDRKNQFEAVKFLKDYLKHHSDVAYVYAGGIIDPGYQEKIKKYAEKNGIKEQVIYVGEVPPGEKLNKYYSASHVSIFPSKLESFGMVIIESISSATHVLLAEDILFDLSSGFDVYKNKSELINLLDAYMDEKKYELAGREEVICKYSWEAVTNEHVKIWT